MGWQDARDSWGIKNGRQPRLEEHRETGMHHREQPRNAGQVEWIQHPHTLSNLVLKCQPKSSNTL